MRIRASLATALLVLTAARGEAQSQLTVSGTVLDAATSRPIIGARVSLGVPPESRTTTTDERGSFFFSRVAAGTYPLSIRRLGYEPSDQSVVVADSTRLAVSLSRVALLDTVRVRGANQAIYGVVATAHDLKPVPNATVQFFGTSAGQLSTDSSGRFFYPVKSTGPYLVRAKATGRGSQTLSVTVRALEGVEVALLLDSAARPGANALEMAFADFRDRMLRRGSASAVVPRSELLVHSNGGVVSSLLTARSFGARTLRFTDEACVFVDGQPRPGLSANAIDAEDVEAVEVYSQTADRSGTLSQRWPNNAPCGDTGMIRAERPRGAQRRPTDVVRWIVIWLKH
jgi:hypothetical protein